MPTRNGKGGTVMQNDAMLEGRYRTIKMLHPDWTEDQVQERMRELADYCEQKEKQWQNPTLIAIWAKKSPTKYRNG